MAAGVLLAASAAAPADANTPVGCSDTALIQAINDSNGGLNDHILDLTSYCVYTLIDADGSLPTITAALTIHGHNATIRRDPNATTDFRIFDVGATSLTMDTLTVMNGNPGTTFPNHGGAVLLQTSGGSLFATDVNFQGNTADNGGAIYADNGTTLSLTGGTITDNRTSGFGGGIRALGTAMVALDSVTASRNRAAGYAGAVSIETSLPATVTNSTVSHNTARNAAGGLYISGTNTVTISGTTIADNRITNSTEGGGGVLVDSNNATSVTITDSTISGNTITGFPTSGPGAPFGGRGAGIFQESAGLILDNTDVIGNQLVGEGGRGAGIATQPDGGSSTRLLTLQNGTTITGNLASGRYSDGGGLYTDTRAVAPVSVTVSSSHIDANKVSGTGAVSGGVYNVGGTYSFTTSSVNNNIAPFAPAPGGVYTDTAITSVDGATTFTGNTPTNCLLSPQPVTNCVN